MHTAADTPLHRHLQPLGELVADIPPQDSSTSPEQVVAQPILDTSDKAVRAHDPIFIRDRRADIPLRQTM